MSEITKPFRKLSYGNSSAIDEIKEEHEEFGNKQTELFRKFAVLDEKIDGAVKQIDLKNQNLANKVESSFEKMAEKMDENNKSNDLIVEKMDEWVDINRHTDARIIKVEEYFQKRLNRNKAIKTALWGLIIAAASVGATKLGEIIFMWVKLGK